MRKYFLLNLNNSTTNKIFKKKKKNTLAVVHIVTHNDDNDGDMHRILKYCIQNLEISLKNMKINFEENKFKGRKKVP